MPSLHTKVPHIHDPIYYIYINIIFLSAENIDLGPLLVIDQIHSIYRCSIETYERYNTCINERYKKAAAPSFSCALVLFLSNDENIPLSILMQHLLNFTLAGVRFCRECCTLGPTNFSKPPAQEVLTSGVFFFYSSSLSKGV